MNAPSAAYHYIKISRLSPDYDVLFNARTYDCAVFAAGNGSVPISFEQPVMDFEANVGDVVKLLDLIRLNNSQCKLLNISSAAVYGNPKALPVNETAEASPISPYGWHKYMSELVCKEYVVLHQLKTCSIRPFSVYGPGLRKQIIWDIFQKMLKTPAAIELFGTGDETRDFIYIDDLVNAITLIIHQAGFNGEVYNVASGTDITIKDLTGLFQLKTEYKGKLTFNNVVREGDPRFWKADITKLKALGFAPQTTIEEGLKKTAEWLKTNP